ncbi:MAG: Fur family transcriptional regulator [Armatimonadota bacterium]|nr:transcriptional repressor [Armatimonadota bacterium]MDW8155331.1 Fur family transcriptional regulator [Armatimonadota bacterium]
MSLQTEFATLRRRLARAGYRLTPQRWTVWVALQELGGHPTAERLYQQVRASHPMVSRATVYKTLDLLVRVGLLTALPAVDGVTRFDAGPPHVNLECVHCGRIEDVQEPRVLAALSRLAGGRGFRVDRGVLVRGTCARCGGQTADGRRAGAGSESYEGRNGHG